MKIHDLAYLVGGIVDGNGAIVIKGAKGIEKAKKGDITFAVDKRKLYMAEQTDVSCILTGRDVKRERKTLIRVDNPKLSFVAVYNALNPPKILEGKIDPRAVISDSVKLGKNVSIAVGVVIEEEVRIGDNVIIEYNCVVKKRCVIGNNCHIFSNVILYENTILGANIILHGGVIIGADGFGYIKENNKIHKFPQSGGVLIEDDVEVGANTTIDRGATGNTVIGRGSKIDNLCQIAHNVFIGKNMLMAAQCGISGSTIIGENVTMGGQVGIVDNVVIGNNVTIGAKSAVIGNLLEGTVVWGLPARPIQQTKRQMAILAKLAKNNKTEV